jgi:3-hydroxyisobutyrate dehydrogenase-like beta-hydroxyacid dehydrogenase
MAQVAFLGLGAMGAGMAGALAQAGHSVTVWNRTARAASDHEEEYGTRAVDTVREAVTQAEVVLACASDDQASAAVWTDPAVGALPALRPGALVLEASTLSPAWSVRLKALVDGAGRHYAEVPVLGSRPQVAARQLVTLVGAEAAEAEEAAGVVAAYSARIEHVGPVGSAAALKLAVNGMLAVQAAGLADVLRLLRSHDVGADAVDVLASLPVISPAAQRLLGLMTRGELAPNYPVRLVAKDMSYAVAATGGDVPVLRAARDAFAAAVERGDGDLDIAGIAAHMTEDTGS